MIRLRHIFPSNNSRAEVDGDRAFFLRSQRGDMLSFYTTRQTRYEGWFRFENDGFIKLLERVEALGPNGPLKVAAITNLGHTVFWEYEDGSRLGWKQVPGECGLSLTASTPLRLRIILDTRGMYRAPGLGRSYERVQPENDGLTLRYTDSELGYPLFLHFSTPDAIQVRSTWLECDYPRDEARHSPPSRLYAYDLGEVTTAQICLGTGTTPEEAVSASAAAGKLRAQEPEVSINYTHDTLLNEVTAAKATVRQSLNWLQSDKGLWAGLPWFHQVWSRDELIAALGLAPEQQLGIIQRYLTMVPLEGELPTYLGSGTTCADGIGWLCLLAHEHGLDHLPDEERHGLVHLLQTARDGLKQHRQANHGLVRSGHNATWMDTIGREGYRLEIQCMYALLLEVLHDLTGEAEYDQERLSFLGKIRHDFWGQSCLKDAPDDTTIRPNIFLAYLLQPDLLAPLAWQGCFDKALSELGTDWGGLTSIARSHPDFHPKTTGEDNQSYHNGDSWFFINNLAGIAMLRLNQHKFGKAIVGILQSSTQEILWENMIGQPGEISSAAEMESYGCGIQAFSGGTYLAMLKEFEDYSAEHARDSISFFWDSTAEVN
ncbi:MAG: amylo-alpha-1,6-glucosidase [bacterium]